MVNELRELFRYRELVSQLVVRDLKVRYKNSVLGFFWSLANPLVQVATITIIVKYVMRLDIPNYSAYLLVAYLPWVFFQMTLMDASDVIMGHHRDLLRKVYFPREVLPISSVIANLIHFILALVVFFAYLLFYHLFLHGAPISLGVLLLPMLLVMQFMLLIGLSFFVSCLNVFYEDTKYLLVALLNVLFYLTPVMYPAELIYIRLPAAHRELLYRLYMLNPVNCLMDAYRKSLLPPFKGHVRGGTVESLSIDWLMLCVCALVCAGFAVAGYAFFNARKWSFAERA